MRRELAALALALVLAPASFLAGLELGEDLAEQRIRVGPYQGDGIRVQVEVYRNGELVYIDYDDPPTKNFAILIAWLFEGSDITTNYSLFDTNGQAKSNALGDLDPGDAAYIFVSYDSTYTYSFNMGALPASYDAAPIGDLTVTIDDVNKTIQFSGTVTVSAPGTVYGVGVYIRLANTAGYIGDFILFFDELGANAFAVNANDVVTVVYKITLP